MKSEADIIYNHIVCSETDEVASIELNYDANLVNILTQYVCKSSKNIFKKEIEKHEAEKKAKFNSVVLMPYFIKESEKWIKKVGIPMNLWSESEHEKFKDYFMDKYKGMMK